MNFTVQKVFLLPPSVHFLYHTQNQAINNAVFKFNIRIMFIKKSYEINV